MKKLCVLVSLLLLLISSVGLCHTPHEILDIANTTLQQNGYLYRLTSLRTETNGTYTCLLNGNENIKLGFDMNNYWIMATYDASNPELVHQAGTLRLVAMCLIGLDEEEQLQLDIEKGNWSYYENVMARQTDVWCKSQNRYVREYCALSGLMSVFKYELQ